MHIEFSQVYRDKNKANAVNLRRAPVQTIKCEVIKETYDHIWKVTDCRIKLLENKCGFKAGHEMTVRKEEILN